MTPAVPAHPRRSSLREEIQRMRLLARHLPVAVAYYESAGRTCRYANDRYAAMFGLDEASIVGLNFGQIIGAAGAAEVMPYADRMLDTGEIVRYERELVLPDGQPSRWIEVQLIPHHAETSGAAGPAGRILGGFVLLTDITRHRRAEQALRESQTRLDRFIHASQEGIVFHRGGLITDVNPPVLQLLGYREDEMLGRMTLEFVPPEAQEQVKAVLARAPDEFRYDSLALHKDGTRVPVEYIVRSMEHQGERQRMIVVRDIRPRLEAEARIHHLAHHDALTGLYNRSAFEARAEARLVQARADGHALALLFLDLDQFKRVNDSLGHAAGDALLRTVAERVSGALRQGDLVSRFGGDEFVVLLAPRAGRPAVAEVATRLLAAIGAPLELQGRSLSVTPSIGVAMYPEHGLTVPELIQHADLAMYESKAHGRARLRFFQPALAEAARADLALEGELARAVREQEFVLHYQPQIGPAGAVIGIEALVRWAHPVRGLVAPNQFIPLAETRRLILPIGEMVLREALAAAMRWRAAGLLHAPMAVNLSSQQFQAAGFVESIERALKAAGAARAADGVPLLELELTERMLMDDVAAVRGTLTRLRDLGVAIAIDDFGTGYTSLGHLRHLPIDRVKVDRSFVKDLPDDARSAALMRAIVQMGRALGLEVVAEGVETAAQRDWVVQHGCTGWQGWLATRALPGPALEAWLRTAREAGGPGADQG